MWRSEGGTCATRPGRTFRVGPHASRPTDLTFRRGYVDLQLKGFHYLPLHGLRLTMRHRPSARLLILDGAGKILLFRFVHKKGALAGQDYWATPGGGVEEGETFEQAAIRELEVRHSRTTHNQ
jgi:NUDIX domain